MWITCRLLWCFYQLFGLSFWRHPFTAQEPLVSKWCNAIFLQICSDEETNSSTSWMAWGLVQFKQILFLGELFLKYVMLMVDRHQKWFLEILDCQKTLLATSCNMHPALLSNSDVNPSQQGHKTAYMSAAVRWKLPELWVLWFREFISFLVCIPHVRGKLSWQT